MFNIIPQPVSILTNSDRKGFTLHSGTIISPYSFSDDFVRFVREHFNKKIIVHEDTGEEKSIILILDDSFEYDEGYTLKCENRRVYITAKTEAGLFYGLQTLKQMLLQKEGKLPYTEITDYPRFSYRGLALEFGRYFYPVEDIKKIVDLMALHKLNVLCWQDSNNHYTQDEFKEVVAYCQEQKIKVVTDNVNSDINSSVSSYHLDYPYGWLSLKKVCSDDGALTDETLGVEAQMCTEYMVDMKRFEYLAFPRFGAMVENAWAESGYPSFATFLHKANDYYKVLDAYSVRYAPIKKACPSLIYKNASSFKFKCMVLGNEGIHGLTHVIRIKKKTEKH